MITSEIKKIIEENPVALATIDSNNRPHVIAVAFVKAPDSKTIVITDNYMKRTAKNIKERKNVALAVWDKNWKGYQIKGVAKYCKSGKWYNFIKKIEENKNEPCKAAIVVKIKEISKLG